MDFSKKYRIENSKLSWDNDYVYRDGKVEPCCICGKPTEFWDDVVEKRFCSEECQAIFDNHATEDIETGIADELGGFHDEGIGYNPDGECCGECSKDSCAKCGIWMTPERFAKMLGDREYGRELTPEEEKLAKDLGLVVVFGYSDDNIELRGAIDDEIGCFRGALISHEDLPVPIRAIWCSETTDCAWSYETSLPHAEFKVYEDGQLYCIGIVCSIEAEKEKR